MAKEIKRSARKKTTPSLLDSDNSPKPLATDLFDRMPPANIEAEKSVVGALLLDPLLCDDIAILLRPDDFYSDALRILYTNILELHNKGTGIDLTLLVHHLRSNGKLDDVGGEEFIADIMGSVQIVANAAGYAKIVQEQSIRRDLIRAGSEILQDAYSQTNPIKEIVGQSEERIFAINDARNSNQVCRVSDLMFQTINMINSRVAGGEDGISTGFYDLNELLGGFHGSELIILAARPAMGKTALAMNIAEHVGVVQKTPVLFFSLEMSRGELGTRMICSRGRIKGEKIRSGDISQSVLEKVTKVASELSQAPIFIDDSPSRTVTEIAAMCRRIKRQEGLGLVVIDYLGLIEPDNANDPRQEQVAKIARRLKGMARELNVPVLCLAQLNRQTEAMKDNKPRLSHLRESGAIEQDADVVMFVHREEYYHTRAEAEEKDLLGKAEIIVAKQRNGPVGTAKLAWISDFTLFTNLNEGDKATGDVYSEFSNDFATNDQGTSASDF